MQANETLVYLLFWDHIHVIDQKVSRHLVKFIIRRDRIIDNSEEIIVSFEFDNASTGQSPKSRA